MHASMMISHYFLHAIGIATVLSNGAVAVPTTSSNSINWKDTVESGGASSKLPGSFSIDQVQNPNWNPRPVNYTKLYVDTLRKHKAPIPKAVYAGVQSRDLKLEERSINLTGYYDGGLWAFPIQVGTPAVTLYVWFDTGSPDLWLFSTGMSTSESAGHTLYSPSDSSSSQLFSGQSFDLNYGAGSVSGDVYTDVLTVGSTQGALSVSGYPLEAATDASDTFTSASGMSGLFGMDMTTYQYQGPNEELTWLAFVNAYAGITFFTVNFHALAGGTWTFGTLDSTQYTGSVSYTTAYDFDGYGYWGINISSYSVGTGSSTAITLPIILDTGSSITIMPAAVCAAYWAQVSGAELYNGQYVFPCTSLLPDFHLMASGGATATLHGTYLNFGYQPYYVPASTYCYGALQPTTGTSVLALSLYQSMFVVFDYGESRIGFANKNLP